MANSSTTCQTCRARHLKCDGASPVCERCKKSKKTCKRATPTKANSFEIHSENSFASGKSKRPRGPRANYTPAISDLELELKALRIYFQDYLQPYDLGEPGGLSECIRAWKASGRESYMVDLAVSSMALATYSRIHEDKRSNNIACSQYEKLLVEIQEKIKHLSDASADNIDACLLSVFLMGRFENKMHGQPATFSTPPPIPQAFSHHGGVSVLLKHWAESSSMYTPSTIVKLSRRGQLRSALLQNRKLPTWLLDGAKFGEEGSDLKFDTVFVRTINVRREVLAALDAEAEASQMTDRLNVEPEILRSILEEWAAALPADTRYRVHNVTQLNMTPQLHFWSTKVFTFQSYQSASSWASYFALSMLLISTRSQALTLYGRADSAAQGKQIFSAQLKIMAENLAAVIPFCLERFTVDGDEIKLRENHPIKPYLCGLVIWSCTIAGALEGVDAALQRWFRDEMVDMGRTTGDTVLQSIDQSSWFILK